MVKRQYLKGLGDGDPVEDLFAVKFKKPVREYRNGLMFELNVSDKTGEMMVKYWGPADKETVAKVYDALKASNVVRIKGVASKYKGVVEIGVSPEDGGQIVPVEPGEFDPEDFVARSERSPDLIINDLIGYVKKVKSEPVQALLRAFFSDEDFVDRFKVAPASVLLHCNWIGGLAEHTLKVVQTCERIADLYPKLDRDLLIAGALLHDVGKIEEYKVNTSIDVTEEGMLRGHVVIGADMVAERCQRVPHLPNEMRLKLIHMVLASHGEPEYGAPKRPQFAEALVVNFADDLDAKVEQYIKIKEEAVTEDPWIWTKRFGNIYLK
jgi:3'-5' exoribonuclease